MFTGGFSPSYSKSREWKKDLAVFSCKSIMRNYSTISQENCRCSHTTRKKPFSQFRSLRWEKFEIRDRMPSGQGRENYQIKAIKVGVPDISTLREQSLNGGLSWYNFQFSKRYKAMNCPPFHHFAGVLVAVDSWPLFGLQWLFSSAFYALWFHSQLILHFMLLVTNFTWIQELFEQDWFHLVDLFRKPAKVSQIVTLTKHNDIDQHLQPATEQGVSL